MPKPEITMTMISDDGERTPSVSMPQCAQDGAVAVTVVVPMGTFIKLEIDNPKETEH